MDFSILNAEPQSITIELQNSDCYKTEKSVEIKIDGTPKGNYDTNVITLDGLNPATDYDICVCDGEEVHKTVRTSEASVLLDVKSFGAKGDGTTLETVFLQATINACPKDGIVYFGKGTYLSGPLFLKSDIKIWLDEGAVILGLANREAYPILPGMVYATDESKEYNFGTWEGNPLSCFASLITGIEVSNVHIYGKGVIDGNAAAGDWWKDAKVKRTAWRPRLVYLCRCRDITLQGVTLCNSPSWTLHPYYSENVNVIGLKIQNPDNSPNTDGIDPESCKNVNVIGTDISVGDDCIAIKSGKYYMALNHYMSTENITVRNCRLNRGHGSVTVGSECAGGVCKVSVSRCIFDKTDRGLRIKTRRGRGQKSVIRDIVFDNIKMIDVGMPITVNMFYFCDPDGHSDYCQTKEALPVDEMTPTIGDITASNMTCTGVNASLLTVYGLPEKKVEKVRLENIKASYKNEADRVPAVPLMMDGMEPMKGKGIYARNVSNLELVNLSIHGSCDTEPDIMDTDRTEVRDVCFYKE